MKAQPSIALFLLCTSCQCPKQPPATWKAEILSAEQKWLTAYHTLDTGSLTAIESPDFTLIVPGGLISKQSQLAMLSNRRSQTGASVAGPSFTMNSRTFRVYGDVAVVSGIAEIGASEGTPMTTAGIYAQTEVWHKANGAWVLVHVHISSLDHGM